MEVGEVKLVLLYFWECEATKPIDVAFTPLPVNEAAISIEE